MSSSPQDARVKVRKPTVVGRKEQVVDLRLSGQHAVERIAVTDGIEASVGCMLSRDRQQLKSLTSHDFLEGGDQRPNLRPPADAVLVRRLVGRDGTGKDHVVRVLDKEPDLVRQAWTI